MLDKFGNVAAGFSGGVVLVGNDLIIVIFNERVPTDSDYSNIAAHGFSLLLVLAHC